MAPKRLLESEEDREIAADKRPRVPSFVSVIAEAMRVQNLQAFLEPLIRRVVSEELERALRNCIPANPRSSTRQIQASESRNLRLQFANKLSLPLFTGSRIEGEQSSSIQIILSDATTGQRVVSGTEAVQKVEIVVLEGDFGHDDDKEWTVDEFDNYVVREREGKRPLLTGELYVSLKDGLGTLRELSFTDNSSWIRSRKFRLGARVMGGKHDGFRIREAKTEAFTVKDHRGELYKKHYPPALDDEVWRLEKIGKDGAFHKKLSKERINTVQDFLRVFVTDPQQLRQVLGNGMSTKMWEGTMEHAKTCILNNKHYVYNANCQNNISIIFNVIYEPVYIVAEGRIIPVGSLAEDQKPLVEKLVKFAYQHRNEVRELEDEVLMGNVSRSLVLQNTPLEVPEGRGDPSYQRTVLVPQQDGQGAQVDIKSQIVGSNFMGRQQSMKYGIGDWLHTGESVNMVAPNQVAMVTGIMQQCIAPQPLESPSLALGPRQTHMHPLASPYQTTNLSSHIYRNGLRNQYAEKGVGDVTRNDWTSESHVGPEGFYRSNSSDELVPNMLNRVTDGEDMQNWFRIINDGSAEQGYNFFPNNQGDPVFTFTGLPQTANLSFNMSGDRLHGKAYRGWLKLKAALKWGISVRKVVAAKRARLEELDD